MKFCPNCGSILMPRNGNLKCKCGYIKSLSNEDTNQYYIDGERKIENKVIITDKDSVPLPTTKITCYRCGGTKGYWWTLQTRSADEAPTYFVKCAKCGNTWRQSN